MHTVKIDLPDDITEEEVKLLLAVKLFEINRISLGKAAELSGYTKSTFTEIACKYNINLFNYSENDFKEELDIWKN